MDQLAQDLDLTKETAQKEPFLRIWQSREGSDSEGLSVAEYLGCGCGFAAVDKA